MKNVSCLEHNSYSSWVPLPIYLELAIKTYSNQMNPEKPGEKPLNALVENKGNIFSVCNIRPTIHLV